MNEVAISRFNFRNNSTSGVRVYLEPWGGCLDVPAQGLLEVKGEAPFDESDETVAQSQCIEIHMREGELILYAWRGATMTLKINGVLQKTATMVFPSF